MASNLPPGVSMSMLPGNRPEDILREASEEKLLDALSDEDLSPAEYEIIADLGLSFIRVIRRILNHKEDMESWR